MRYWVRRGWIVPASGGGTGHPQWFELDDATIRRLEATKARRRDDGSQIGGERASH